MSAQRRLTIVAAASLGLGVLVWVLVLPGAISVSTALWLSFAIALGAFVGVKFRKHADLPDIVKLH